MTLLEIAEMISFLLNTENVYAGNIDSNIDQSIGVYSGSKSGIHKVCLGGEEQTKTREKNISILIHWTDNPSDSELNAYRILDILVNVRNYEYDGGVLRFMLLNDPISVGRDNRGICEYVIEGKIYYERI